MVTPVWITNPGDRFSDLSFCGRSGPSFETLLAQLLRKSRTAAAFEIAAPSVFRAFGVSVATGPSPPGTGAM